MEPCGTPHDIILFIYFFGGEIVEKQNEVITFRVVSLVPTSWWSRRSASPGHVEPPRRTPSALPRPSASATPPPPTRRTTWQRSCRLPICRQPNLSRWATTRATEASPTHPCPQPKATVSTSRPSAEPTG